MLKLKLNMTHLQKVVRTVKNSVFNKKAFRSYNYKYVK